MTLIDAMDDGARPSPGYRLQRLELSNWGTFDSSGGGVHVVTPRGATTLLVGQNGSGKSTLVDALLTLFVRPVVRNYNVAAGAMKTERDERTYIRGAFDRRSRDEDNRAEVQYLRPDGRHYSVLLAAFQNDRGDAFTVAQILYLTGDNQVEKVYCVASGEKSIAADCAGLATTERVKRQLEQRGFQATVKYQEYLAWISKRTNIRPKAMDVFNQTVAVKDIQSLNKFIREHMLESTPWMERIDRLQAHFQQLTEAHQSLVRVRRQSDMLRPIAERGETYAAQAEELQKAELLFEAVRPYFQTMTVELLEPLIEALAREIESLEAEQVRLDSALTAARDDERRIQNEIEHAGGERLREIPLLIRRHESERDAKRERHGRFRIALAGAGLADDGTGVRGATAASGAGASGVKTVVSAARVTDEDSLRLLHQGLPELLQRLSARAAELMKERDALVLDRGDAHRELAESRRELEALRTRTSKLPEHVVQVRRQICESLRLPEGDLPFAAELITVPAEERPWEASIEMVLRSFALSLLVPQRHYALVSAHVDRTRIRDGLGRGQRLVYLRVGERSASGGGAVARPQSLLRKVKLKDQHLLAPWVRGELEARFDYQCCDTIEQFQLAPDMALTRERHVKARGIRHEKDDRERTADPRHFVLGWDNREKRRHLAGMIERLEREIREMEAALTRLDVERSALDSRRHAANELAAFTSYAVIDFASEELAIAELRREQRALEDASDAIRTLRQSLTDTVASQRRLQDDRDDVIRRHGSASQDIRLARTQVIEARRALGALERDGILARLSSLFPDLARLLEHEPLTPQGVLTHESAFREERRLDVERRRTELEPLRGELCRFMNQYLREFKEEQSDLDASIEFLDDFRQAYEHIRREDLPRHEQRFKERLNEKVVQEIGLLNGAFQTERIEIEQKIALLNRSLQQLEYRPGTFMRLEPRAVRDVEIQDFQSSLRECLAGTFEGTPAADEARYLRIAKLIERLRDDVRWREKVTDVRRWFDFVARELDAATGGERSCYEDSTGQSGGEKAKLAFTILVAAIAYQYDIDPGRPASDRFHFVVVDEMFSKVDDRYAEYALELFRQFGLQLLIVAPLDAKARVTEPYVECYLHVVKDLRTHRSEIFSMTAREFSQVLAEPAVAAAHPIPGA